MTEEKCANCRHLKKLYVPPIHKDIPRNAFVCDLFIKEGNQVMYLSDDTGRCECFLPIKQEHDGCVGCVFEDSKDMSKCGICKQNYMDMWESAK